jgi:type II secretory pathway component PulC
MKLEKLLMIIPLLIITSVIWYTNIRRLKEIADKDQGYEITERVDFYSDSLPGYNFIYKDIQRDPFNVIPDTNTEEPTRPSFILKGIVLCEDKASALMEFTGETYLVKKGETYLGVKVKEITPKSVTIEFRGKEETLYILE